MKNPSRLTCAIDRVTGALGHPVALAAAIVSIVAWGLTGPVFGFAETWQLVINTGTTIVTFVMVFVIQNSQNRADRALQTKLDQLLQLVGALVGEDELELVGLEDEDEKTIKQVQARVRGR